MVITNNISHNDSSPSKLEGVGGRVSSTGAGVGSSPSKLEGVGGRVSSTGAGVGSSPSKLEGVGGSVSPTGADKTVSPTATRWTKNLSQMKAFRRELRGNSTLAEKMIWNWLKGDKVKGLRFRRQFSIGNYILDFYCPRLKLAIELDGDYHYHGGMVASDANRDSILWQVYGIKTLRFVNEVAIKQPFIIVNAVLQYAASQGMVADTLPLTPSNLEGELPSGLGGELS